MDKGKATYQFGSSVQRATLETFVQQVTKARREFNANKQAWPNVLTIHPDDAVGFQTAIGNDFVQQIQARTGMTVEIATSQDDCVKPGWLCMELLSSRKR